MTVRSLVYWPDAVLAERAVPVEAFDESLLSLAADLTDTLVAAQGLGLAAPQIGVSQRVIAVLDDSAKPLVLVNPKLLPNDSVYAMRVERCLSLPGVKASVRRQARVTVRAQTVAGDPVEFECGQHMACAIQHEVDHLDGIVMVQHESYLKQELARNKMRSFKKRFEVTP